MGLGTSSSLMGAELPFIDVPSNMSACARSGQCNWRAIITGMSGSLAKSSAERGPRVLTCWALNLSRESRVQVATPAMPTQVNPHLHLDIGRNPNTWDLLQL